MTFRYVYRRQWVPKSLFRFLCWLAGRERKPSNLFYIERDRKYGGFDFGASCAIAEFTYAEMQEFRAMLVVAIGTAEDMFRREAERRNPAMQALSPEP